MLARVDSLVMPCRYMLDLHRREGFSRRMDYLPYFVEPVRGGDDPSLEEEFGGLRPYFLFVARLEPYKGARAALSAYLKKKGRTRLVMVGTGSMERELKDLAAGDDRIRFLDYVPPAKLDRLYAHATALLAPSVWPEMGNLTVLQAFSCGTPVIASGAGLLPELVEKTGAGVVFRGEEEFVSALDRMEEEDFRQRFVEPALRAYREEYSPRKFLERYYRLIEEFSP
jgi:glycosyltransferase involved in cell wall biosynthesis